MRADGFHLIDAEMVSISLADELVFSPGSGLTVVDEVPGGLGVARVPGGADNLVARALRAVGRPRAVRLRKRIPTGAGLGGGSADAAAVLRWAGVRDHDLAVRLGADVPFCVAGGRARVTGIGEVLHPLALEERHFVILLPPIFVDTAAVYRTWDEDRAGGSAVRQGAALGGNDLEPPALAVQPALAQWKERFAEVTGLRPRLAGSGSAWFVEGTLAQLGLDGLDFVALGEVRAPVLAVSTVPGASTDAASVGDG